MTKVRPRLVALLLPCALAACGVPHFDLQIDLRCGTADGGTPPPASCQAMDLGCANFLEASLYEWQDGVLGDVLRTSCLTRAQLGSPADLCGLEQMAHAYTLFSTLPVGKTVRFRLRALNVADPSDGCNIDVPPLNPKNTVLFDGFSEPIHVDSSSHQVTLPLSACGSCGNSMPSTTDNCLEGPCPCVSSNGACRTLGATCGDGTVAQVVEGDCCATCTSSSAE